MCVAHVHAMLHSYGWGRACLCFLTRRIVSVWARTLPNQLARRDRTGAPDHNAAHASDSICFGDVALFHQKLCAGWLLCVTDCSLCVFECRSTKQPDDVHCKQQHVLESSKGRMLLDTPTRQMPPDALYERIAMRSGMRMSATDTALSLRKVIATQKTSCARGDWQHATGHCSNLHICIYTYIYIYLHVLIKQCARISACKCTQVYIYMHISKHIYIYTDTYTYMSTCWGVHVHVFPCWFAHNNGYTCMSMFKKKHKTKQDINIWCFTSLFLCVYICMYMSHPHTYLHIYIHVYIDAYLYICTYGG